MLGRIMRRLGRKRESDDLARTLHELAVAQQQQTAALQARLKSLAELVGQRSTAKDAREILHAVRALVTIVEEGSGGGPGDDGERRQPATKLFRALDAVAKGEGPIVVGPWTGEIGFEVLYWIPFVEWFRTRWRVPSERLVIVSRGGVESWYGMAGARYLDIFSLLSASEFRERSEGDKQRDISPLDRHLYEMAASRCELNEPAYLHPRFMYQTLEPFWKDEAGFGLLTRFTNHRRMDAIDDEVLTALPDNYVAVRFYFSNCFPDKPKNRAFARAVVSGLSEQAPVVVLTSGLRLDDHSDYLPEPNDRVITIAAGVQAARNLAVQSAVIGRARAFVGTYGGYSYLAPFHGVPSVGFYSQQSFKLHHLYAAQRVLERLGQASVMAVNVAHAELVREATAGSISLADGKAADADHASAVRVPGGARA